MIDGREFILNCYGEPEVGCSVEINNSGIGYDEKTMTGWHDSEGFDGYGYSAFDGEGEYVGIGVGIDRAGYTEMDYLAMDSADFDYGCFDHLTSFPRNRD
jgi:hypothetical protein